MPDPTTVDPGGYRNPVRAVNHPDPAVLAVGDTFYLYSTNGSLGAMPVLSSPDLVDWTDVGDGMPRIAPWSRPGRHWAPEVIRIGDRYLSYYTAWRADIDQQAVSVAVADSPVGPFTDDRQTALIAQTAEGGSIDASPFRDADGSLWLIWKNDGNHIGVASAIYRQRLSDDGLELVGEPQRMFGMDQPYETYTIEGATVIIHRSHYFCLYSTGEFWNDSYGVCWAVAPSLEGPWTKGEKLILSGNAVAAGPGHGMPIKVGADWWYVYHAWSPDHIGEQPGRQVWLSKIDFTEAGPVIDGPNESNPVRPAG